MSSFGVEVDDLDTDGAEPLQATGEVTGFADDERAQAELANEAATVPARGKRADHDEVAIGSLASGAAEGVGFAVDRGSFCWTRRLWPDEMSWPCGPKMAAPIGMPPSERPRRASESATASIAVWLVWEESAETIADYQVI